MLQVNEEDVGSHNRLKQNFRFVFFVHFCVNPLAPLVLANLVTMSNRPPPPDQPPRNLTAPAWPPNPSTWAKIDHAKVSEMPNKRREAVTVEFPAPDNAPAAYRNDCVVEAKHRHWLRSENSLTLDQLHQGMQIQCQVSWKGKEDKFIWYANDIRPAGEAYKPKEAEEVAEPSLLAPPSWTEWWPRRHTDAGDIRLDEGLRGGSVRHPAFYSAKLPPPNVYPRLNVILIIISIM